MRGFKGQQRGFVRIETHTPYIYTLIVCTQLSMYEYVFVSTRRLILAKFTFHLFTCFTFFLSSIFYTLCCFGLFRVFVFFFLLPSFRHFRHIYTYVYASTSECMYIWFCSINLKNFSLNIFFLHLDCFHSWVSLKVSCSTIDCCI